MIYWDSWTAFLHMGGYGVYVWGTLAMATAVVAVELGQLRLRARRLHASGGGSSAP